MRKGVRRNYWSLGDLGLFLAYPNCLSKLASRGQPGISCVPGALCTLPPGTRGKAPETALRRQPSQVFRLGGATLSGAAEEQSWSLADRPPPWLG